MILDILLLIVGLTLILVGANLLTDGAVIIARRFNIPSLVIGLTIVAIGTSTPEIVVSITSAIKGDTSMAIGNVLGSNIFNVLVILGITALIRPIRLSRENSFRNIPIVIATTLLFTIMASSLFGIGFMPNHITRVGGAILLLSFILFSIYTVRSAGKPNASKITEEPAEDKSLKKRWLAIPMIIAGLAGLIYGGDLFLTKAVNIATSLGVSNYIISITLMAGGTSLPELAACITAARKGESQMALGNVIGSNISNLLLVLGSSAIFTPLSLANASIVDISVLLISTSLLIVTPFSFKRHQIDRKEGAILIAIYIAYITYLVAR